MSDLDPILVAPGAFAVQLPRAELPALAAALKAALSNAELVRESGAPQALTSNLPSSWEEAEYSVDSAEVRAGRWVLSADGAGLHWQNRLAPPQRPQVGMMLVAPVVRSAQGWTVPRLVFKRLY